LIRRSTMRRSRSIISISASRISNADSRHLQPRNVINQFARIA
jgi:hypothetical protein